MAEIKIGEVVMLNGERMVVAFIPGDGSVLDRKYRQHCGKGDIGCRWFNKKLAVEIEFFPAPSLERIESPNLPPPSFKVGDRVRLKSGGPAMTMTFRAGDGSREDRKYGQHCDKGDIGCHWFDKGKSDKRDCFNPASLEYWQP